MDEHFKGYETFSIRQKKSQVAGGDDVYQYDVVPPRLRGQIIHIWTSAIGPWADREEVVYDNIDEGHMEYYSNSYWASIYRIFCRVVGLVDLPGDDAFDKLKRFFLEAEATDALNLIDLTFQVINKEIRELWNLRESRAQREATDEVYLPQEPNEGEHSEGPDALEITQRPDEAIEELNRRFREHGIGYDFVEGELIKLDSQYLHQEVTRSAIKLLHDPAFRGPSDEFLGAHEHYRSGSNKEAIAEALKAFESTLKTVCDGLGWSYDKRATASTLIGVVLDNGLVDNSLQSYFNGLREILQSGLPTIRNKTSGHGQGSQPVEVPDYLTAFALHTAGASIVMLVEAYRAKLRHDAL